MTQDGVWRDEKRLPLKDLQEAVATSPVDGQVDDLTGNDAGMEQVFGDELRGTGSGDDAERGDPDPTSEEGRRLRPSLDGPLGPS